MNKGNIVLVGFMGAGKTAVGKTLAAKLHRSFLDMDGVIEEREGKTIPKIFAEDGEPRFRLLERKLVRELSLREDLVIAAGGGVVLNPDNIADFSRTGLVVCLTATPETILERVKHDTNRPLLAVEDKIGRITSLLEQRRKFYDAVPHRVDTSRLTTEQVAAQILDIFRQGARPATSGTPHKQ